MLFTGAIAVGMQIAYKFEQMPHMARKDILDKETVQMKLQRMAYEVVENNLDEKKIILVGIKDNGSVIARNVKKILNKISPLEVEIVNLGIDKKYPKDVELSEQNNFSGEVIIIVDDVANSGQTLLYSLKPFLEFRPRKIQTMALVERTHKTFPMHLDYTGLSVATTLQEHIFVQVEGEEVVGAYME
jgi:pyrimidine operon attenuation protein/uracil phosphoribosyltransferase